MRDTRVRLALTGLAAGALLTAVLLVVSVIGTHIGAPSIPYSLFEWLTRVLPGRLVIFGLETTLRLLEALGLNIKDTGKTVEIALALTGLLLTGAVVGLLFFTLVPGEPRRPVLRAGEVLGLALGVASYLIALAASPPATFGSHAVGALWVVGSLLLWGWVLARLRLLVAPAVEEAAAATAPPAAGPESTPAGPESTQAAPPAAPAYIPLTRAEGAPAPPAEAATIDRRHFIIRVGGAVATFVVLGAELSEILKAEAGPVTLTPVKAPIPFPNAGSPVKPVPGTRLEYTPVSDHYRVDIDLVPPSIDGSSWRLKISGLVERPLSLTLDQLRSYPATDQFITLSCISNPVGGPLIGTTLWSGPPFRDVLAGAGVQPSARFAHLLSQDGFDEAVDLDMIRSDPRIVLAHSWNGQPLPTQHGFPLRVYLPDHYGMKQPKWITDVVLVPDSIPGYWVKRGWDRQATMRTTSVIDVVATGGLDHRNGQTYVPVGGIAHAGDRGISRVEIQVDGGPWEPAELRAPLSGLTWVIWRYEWPFARGEHVFAVRAYDGSGQLQSSAEHDPYPAGASGIDTKSAVVT
ncbi:MAG TPA: molybdopterin-dependent oxidoreductase [Thermoleophilia bacterium]|nr:molybdopterin-dependent oxidoreductase [Thermoleophilia bacterium]